MWSGRGLPSRSRRFQSKRRNVVLLACWISAITSPSPQRVDRARFEEDAIADLGLDLMQAIVAGAGGEFAFEPRAVDARLEAGVDFAPRLGREHDPGLGLAEIGRREPGALRVVRMDLHGEGQLGVEEFQQQRELRLRMMPTQERRAEFGHELVQRFAGERSVGDDALVRAVVDDFPALGVAVAVAERLSQDGAQAAAAPNVLFEKRLKSEWFEQRHVVNHRDSRPRWQGRSDAARVVSFRAG